MDLRQLEVLRAVAETGSFTSAGQQLHLSQSAVSRQILLLEEELNEQLFLRLGRKIRITPVGTTLVGLSRRMFDDFERTRASILAADLGLLTLPIDDPNLVSVPVMREELLLVTAPTHPLARKKQVTPQDLANQPFVLFETGSGSVTGSNSRVSLSFTR